ncbi:hypothetical protein KUTeg_014753 [Tegillarca granosa]|uniref:Uncharacterized protein n=1 Tax=Tegillarca granosa TaxID=220873 RepID=A0ABQ9ER69_TEGGR|nr:hypothetical protein KUTeg_014753 [Tegillarca granosa]
MSRRQTQTDSFQSSNSDFCIEETKEKDIILNKYYNFRIDASDEDGSCGHLIQNSLNYPWRCKKVKLTTSGTETENLRRKKKLKTNYLNENYMNKTGKHIIVQIFQKFCSTGCRLTKKSKSQKKSLKGETKEKIPERHQWTKEEKLL